MLDREQPHKCNNGDVGLTIQYRDLLYNIKLNIDALRRIRFVPKSVEEVERFKVSPLNYQFLQLLDLS